MPYPVAPAGPAPGLAYAGFWIRFAGYLIDGLILDIPLYTLFFFLFAGQFTSLHCYDYNSGDFGNGFSLGCTTTLTGLFYLGTLVIWAVHGVYFSLLWSLRGRSIGQMAVGVYVVDAHTGARITLGKAVGRFLGLVISSIPFSLGLMWAGWDPQKQGWHDKMAGTFVVRRI